MNEEPTKDYRVINKASLQESAYSMSSTGEDGLLSEELSRAKLVSADPKNESFDIFKDFNEGGVMPSASEASSFSNQLQDSIRCSFVSSEVPAEREDSFQ